MILIPEISTVLILVPRTGSGSLRRAIAAAYPQSVLIYRHMEADGVPAGYDRWRRVGVVRHPVERLWSLYKFMRNFAGDHDPAYVASMRDSAKRPFCEWLTQNQTVFTSPYDSAGRGRYWPQFTVRHPLPENRKSQFVYLRPDLGTEIVPYEKVGDLAAQLFIALDRHNQTTATPPPPLTPEAADHVSRVFAWDFEAVAEARL
ncbi:hypothetical protein [Allomesorhizobium camelthorni]|uniref:Sulfotransferase family protein n=1 Tax=Allomesorhizobium camelthorni TaxID=475069 RepID=A0A6G4W8L6_9HYPH|nr:hypothetical protein [Mesorhizobium camelthorni]NGO50487.1 hypothetical protein [Mesorhizobium camelthorni]